MKTFLSFFAIAFIFIYTITAADDWNPIKKNPKTEFNNRQPDNTYKEAVRLTQKMVYDYNIKKLAANHGLNVMNITWEDTGRYKNSSVGPNISDMSIQVALNNQRNQTIHTMPVIRYPNYSDLSTDLNPRDITLLIGNEKGEKLKRISLYDFLAHPRDYLHNSDSWKGQRMSLLAKRDKKVLVSAQACFLPVPKKGMATFNPVLFNYQSYKNNPAVLTILATREGTSVTVIDNQRDAFSNGSVWGQRLFHNDNGQRSSLTAQRFSDFKPVDGDKYTSDGKPKVGLSMVLLIQVPLKFKERRRYFNEKDDISNGIEGFDEGGATETKSAKRSDVEMAVIGHGKAEGPFTEIDNLSIERDYRFPVRVTVQFYKATSNGVANESDFINIKNDIDTVYKQGDVISSLVVGGRTGRITEYDGSKVQPADWWERFWTQYEQTTGIPKYTAVKKLQALLGYNYMKKPVTELYIRDLIRQ